VYFVSKIELQTSLIDKWVQFRRTDKEVMIDCNRAREKGEEREYEPCLWERSKAYHLAGKFGQVVAAFLDKERTPKFLVQCGEEVVEVYVNEFRILKGEARDKEA
jgi:hypothetical protein